MPTKDELLAQAEEAGVEVPEKATKREIAELLSDDSPEVPSAVAALAELDAPTDPLPGVPVEPEEGLHAELGAAQPALEAPSDEAGVDPVVLRGPLDATPADAVLGGHAGRVEDGAPPIKTGA